MSSRNLKRIFKNIFSKFDTAIEEKKFIMIRIFRWDTIQILFKSFKRSLILNQLVAVIFFNVIRWRVCICRAYNAISVLQSLQCANCFTES